MPRDLRHPLRIDCLRQAGGRMQIKRQIGDVDEIVHPHEARRKQQAHRRTVPIDTVEVAELRDDAARGIDDDDFVGRFAATHRLSAASIVSLPSSGLAGTHGVGAPPLFDVRQIVAWNESEI